MLRLAEQAARLAGQLSRITGRGGGTTLPGVVLLRLRPDAVRELGAELGDGTVLVSATNGKTTTTRLISSWARTVDPALVTNAAGSNLERGVAAALLQRGAARLGVFEVDEAALPAVAGGLQPRVIALLNLFRDQLDRYGELEALVDEWADLATAAATWSPSPMFVLNADDPNIAELGSALDRVVWFGIDSPEAGRQQLAHAADATVCRRCGSALIHDVVMLGHLGHWRCSNCDATRPQPDVAVTAVELRGSDGVNAVISVEGAGAPIQIESALPGLHNVYNIAAAVAVAGATAAALGRELDVDAVVRTVGATTAAFGRGEQVRVGATDLNLMLAKNPTGVNQNLRTILGEAGDLDLLVLLNDRTADGRDVSWIWDVDWELLQGRVGSLTLSGDRAWDLALRFKYGGFEIDPTQIVSDPADALDRAVDLTGTDGRLHVLPTYTAMLDLREVLTERGHTSAYWQAAR